MFTIALLVAAAPITVLTSSSTNDAATLCLLDAKPTCTWRAGFSGGGASDNGVDEGIGLRFAEPLGCQDLEVTLKSAIAKAPLDVSFGAYGQDMQSKDGGKTWRTHCYPSSTLFLRVIPSGKAAPEITSVRFLDKDQPVDVALPKGASATASATSVLEPRTAYQPAFLFDSKTDLAWASDGKKGDGKGVTISLAFDAPQEVAGVLVWNGYQRSTTHFTANSRAAKISVKAGDKAAQVALDTSSLSMQRHTFDALPASKTIDVVIDAVAAGAKYKDLVISELRFLDKSGRVIAPNVSVEKTPAPAALASSLDRSFAGAIASVEAVKASTYCVDRRLRVRSGGSFVIYTGDDKAPDGTGVIEGGWNAKSDNGDALRVFGKQYRTVVTGGEYGGMEDIVPAIFQSDLTLRPLAKLSAAEQTKVIDVALDVSSASGHRVPNGHTVFARDGSVLAGGKTAAETKKALIKALIEKGAIAAQSSVYTDVLLPTDVAGACAH